jgi:hypothetical protein
VGKHYAMHETFLFSMLAPSLFVTLKTRHAHEGERSELTYFGNSVAGAPV